MAEDHFGRASSGGSIASKNLLTPQHSCLFGILGTCQRKVIQTLQSAVLKGTTRVVSENTRFFSLISLFNRGRVDNYLERDKYSLTPTMYENSMITVFILVIDNQNTVLVYQWLTLVVPLISTNHCLIVLINGLIWYFDIQWVFAKFYFLMLNHHYLLNRTDVFTQAHCKAQQ